MRFPVIARKFPVRLKKFPVLSLREFAKIIEQCQHVTGELAARSGCFCKNSLFFPCLTGNSALWNQRTVRSGLPPPPARRAQTGRLRPPPSRRHGPPRAMRGSPPPAGRREGAFRAGGRESGPGVMGLGDDPDTLERPARIPEDAVTMPLPARFFASEPSVLVHRCRQVIHPTVPQSGATLRSSLNHPF